MLESIRGNKKLPCDICGDNKFCVFLPQLLLYCQNNIESATTPSNTLCVVKLTFPLNTPVPLTYCEDTTTVACTSNILITDLMLEIFDHISRMQQYSRGYHAYRKHTISLSSILLTTLSFLNLPWPLFSLPQWRVPIQSQRNWLILYLNIDI